MSSYQLNGKIYEILPLVQVNDKFKKQEFILEKMEQVGNFPSTDYIKFQLTQNRTNLMSNFKVGDEVEVSFNIRGNKWVSNDKVNYFTNLDAWKIEGKGNGTNQPGTEPPAPEYNPGLAPPDDNNDDLLPF